MVKILRLKLIFSSTVPSLLMKDALSLPLYIALIVKCYIVPIIMSASQMLLFWNTSQISSNDFKIVNTSIGHTLSSKIFDGSFY